MKKSGRNKIVKPYLQDQSDARRKKGRLHKPSPEPEPDLFLPSPALINLHEATLRSLTLPPERKQADGTLEHTLAPINYQVGTLIKDDGFCSVCAINGLGQHKERDEEMNEEKEETDSMETEQSQGLTDCLPVPVPVLFELEKNIAKLTALEKKRNQTLKLLFKKFTSLHTKR